MSVKRYKFDTYEFERVDVPEMERRANAFYELMNRRRSVRELSTEGPPRKGIDLAIRAASTAPQGAHRQPRRFYGVDDAARRKASRGGGGRRGRGN